MLLCPCCTQLSATTILEAKILGNHCKEEYVLTLSSITQHGHMCVCNYCTTFYLSSPLLIQNIIRKIISYGWHFPQPIFYCEGFGQCVCMCTLLFSHKHCSRVQNRLQGLRRRFKGKSAIQTFWFETSSNCIFPGFVHAFENSM